MQFQPSESYRAQRCSIFLGDIPLEVVMLPDGSYRLSHTEVTAVISKPRNSMLRFCRSKYLKSTLGKDFECYNFTEELSVEGANRPISPVPIEVAVLYWQRCAQEGNAKAQALVVALVRRSIYDLADEVFGVSRTRQERDLTLEEDLSPQGVDRLQSMSQQLGLAQATITETQAERELKLKIQLTELELEKERLRHSRNSNCLSAKDMTKIGAMSWLATQWVQRTLGYETEGQAYEQMCRWGYSLESGRWLRSQLTDDLFVLPWSSFDTLAQFVKRLKSEQN